MLGLPDDPSEENIVMEYFWREKSGMVLDVTVLLWMYVAVWVGSIEVLGYWAVFQVVNFMVWYKKERSGDLNKKKQEIAEKFGGEFE